jgi:hypothetical protein
MHKRLWLCRSPLSIKLPAQPAHFLTDRRVIIEHISSYCLTQEDNKSAEILHVLAMTVSTLQGFSRSANSCSPISSLRAA